jgi:hypothetical protein
LHQVQGRTWHFLFPYCHNVNKTQDGNWW